MSKLLLVLLALTSIAVISVGSILIYSKLANKSTSQIWPVLTTNRNSSNQLFSGTVKKIGSDLGLIVLTPADIENGAETPVYYSAGIYQYGKYQGFTRIVAIKPNMGPIGPTVLVLATKDFKTYILDSDKYSADNFEADSYNNPLSGLDTKKVTKVEILDSEHPSSIDLDTNFSLFKLDILTTSISVSSTSGYAFVLLSDLSDYKTVNLSKLNLTFYSPTNTETEGEHNNFINGDTSFLVKDETGLLYKYNMTFKSLIPSYFLAHQKYLEALVADEKAVKAEPGVFHPYPEYVSPPSLSFNSSEVVGKENLYKKYSVALPQACGMDTATKVLKNISDSDLVSIGKIGDISVYKFKDSNHPLLKQEFESKVNYDKAFFKSVNNIDPPTYASYAAKNPLLVIKDQLGRFVAVGEFDYLLPGGCGKPVVYLYPEVSTVVSVKLATPIEFTHTIPTYDKGKGWEVLANPNGKLQNLSNSLENCSNYTNEFGFEYAKKSCIDNSYPYLYWSGTSITKPYPKMDEGWVVTKGDLSAFLTEKLSYMGLNQNEINDFTSYWLNTMLKKDSPYYRVSFLQNKELNALIPMDVNPMPKTTIRIFMDWQPLDSIVDITPQELVQSNRNGFTLVEWGGLKF